MALNKAVFKTRALTALLFVIVMLTGLFWNAWAFIALFTIIHFGCWYEFIKLLKNIHPKNYLLYSLLGLLYITMPILLILNLGIHVEILTTKNVSTIILNQLIPVGIFCCIWLNDTAQYLVGSFFGKTPFSKISPKKTWEGTAGGAILCVVVIALVGTFIPIAKHIETRHWVAIASICAVFGTVGDLLESKIKRLANVKDSGNFMPGHGGFLDRFDSFLIATPVVWLYVHTVL